MQITGCVKARLKMALFQIIQICTIFLEMDRSHSLSYTLQYILFVYFITEKMYYDNSSNF